MIKVEPTKVLAIYPCTRGFSYAVMESPLKLLELNLISPKKFDKEKLLNAMKRIVEAHIPITLVLENCNSKYCRKGSRTKNLIQEISLWAMKKQIPVKFYSRDQVRNVFGRWKAYTKYEIAIVLSRNIPELQQYMYDKPKYPERDNNNSSLFSSISLAITNYYAID